MTQMTPELSDEDVGYGYFNLSNEEWEWCRDRPCDDEAADIHRCTLAEWKRKQQAEASAEVSI